MGAVGGLLGGVPGAAPPDLALEEEGTLEGDWASERVRERGESSSSSLPESKEAVGRSRSSSDSESVW